MHPMNRENHPRRKGGPLIYHKSNSQDRLIEELQGKLGISRKERPRKNPDDWLTEGVIVMNNPKRSREGPDGEKVEERGRREREGEGKKEEAESGREREGGREMERERRERGSEREMEREGGRDEWGRGGEDRKIKNWEG